MLPDDVEEVCQLINSKAFKKFHEAEIKKLKGGLRELDSILRHGVELERVSLILKEPKVQALIVRYLKGLKKPEKKGRYSFLLAYEGFSSNKNNQ